MVSKHTCPRRMEGLGYDVVDADTWRRDGTCSYCGSLSPERFFEAIERGDELGPTDKNYKVYVHGDGHRKFYFQHLDDAGRARFIDLLNERPRRMQIGYPGHFYRPPFFVRFA